LPLEALSKLVKPPAELVFGGDDLPWNTIESELGTRLPDDYKQFVGRFGMGKLNGFISFTNPLTANPYLNLIKRLELFYEGERTMLLNQPDASELFPPFPLHPESPGLLPWGVTDNGQDLLWHTSGQPDQWPVIVYTGRDGRYEEFPLTMTQFLAGILAGEQVSELFPEDFPGKRHWFEPYRAEAARPEE